MAEETWLESAKKRVAEQKRLFRSSGNEAVADRMLTIGDTNFLITPKQARLILALELACDDLRKRYDEESDEWIWGSEYCNMAKVHQLACGNPDNYRNQFLEAIKAESKEIIEKGKSLIGRL